jgi:hypothetical protein
MNTTSLPKNQYINKNQPIPNNLNQMPSTKIVNTSNNSNYNKNTMNINESR